MNTVKNISSYRLSLLLVALFAVAISSWGITSSYYSSLNGKSGADLFSAAHSIAKNGYSSLTYDGLWTAYQTTDVYPSGHANAGKIWDMYGGCSFTYSTNQCGNYSDVCDCYNREHSIPKSWFGGSESKNTPGSDLFHIFPTDGKVNGMRSNYAFGEVNSGTTYQGGSKLGTAKSITISNTIIASGSSTQSCSASKVFEPIDEYKGDFARAYMGTMVRWASGDYQTFTTDDGSVIFNTAYTAASYYGLTKYGVALLMKWHRQDPVSQKEIDRNNAVQNKQGNRNPFIDYPCLAEYIWGEHAGETFQLSNAVGSFESGFTAGSSSGCTSGGTTTNYTITWKVNGSTWASTTSSGSSVGSLPTTPTSSNCDGSKVFVGWTTSQISTATNTAPSPLFTDASGAPSISANKTFYAVFATATTSGGGGSSTITFTPGTDTGETSVTKSGVTCTMTTMNNSSYYQIYANQSGTFSYASGNITNITFGCTASGTTKYGPGNASADVGTYSYSGATGTWTGSASSVTISSTAQVRMSSLSVTISGASTTTYSGYITECSSSVTCSLSSISLNTSSVQTSFTTGSTFNYTGLVVTANYSNCSSKTVTPTSVSSPNMSTAGTKTITVSYTENGTTKTATYTITVTAPVTYTVAWKLNGSNYTTGNPTTSVTSGNQVANLPTPPTTLASACSDYTFAGWSATDIGSSPTATQPTDLFTTESASPAITENTIFYAVFSKTSGSLTTTTDNITLSTTGVTSGSTSYSNWSGKTVSSSAVYAGNSAGGNASIQLRSTSPSGIVTTTSGGTATKVVVTWNGNTASGRTIDVYGKTTAYTSGSDLYSTSTQGTKLGSVVYGTSTTLDISGSYTYIGLRSNNSAQYVSNVAITWQSGSGSIEYITRCAAAVTYTVTYNKGSNGTGTNTTDTKTQGVALTLKGAIFTRTGYTQTGWSTTDGGSKAYDLSGSYTTNADVTLYPYWTINTYTVTYNKGSNGTGTNTTDTKTYGVALALKGAIFTRTGYTQTGWSTTAAGTAKAYDLGASYTANADITLYPYWEPITYTITYKPGANGTGTEFTGTKTYGVTATLSSTTFTRIGYTQTGWSTADGGSKTYSLGGSYSTNANLTLYPYWSINSWTLTVQANNSTYGAVSGGGSYNYNASRTITATPNAGYTFSYWTLNGTIVSYSTTYTLTMPDNDVTYIAVFAASTNTAYTVNHFKQNEDGTTYPVAPTETETLTGTTGGTTTATAKSYEGFTAGTITQATIAADGSTVVSIYYARNTYTVTYNRGTYGTGTNTTDTKLYGVVLTLKGAIFTRTGYTQTGWSNTDGGSKAYDLNASYTANSAATLYPYWAANTNTAYTVKHFKQNEDGSTYPSTPTETETLTGTTGGTTAAVAKSYEGFNAQTFSQAPIAADGSTVVSIYYKRNTFTITYNKGTNGTGTNSTDTKLYDVALTLKGAIFTRTGYTQTGWASNAAGTAYVYALNGNYTANSGTTLYPYWTELPKYTVTFINGSTTYDSKTNYEGTSISVTPPTPCTGFTFVGWSTTQYSTTNTTAPTIDYTGNIPAGNTTYYAVYSKQGESTTQLTNNYRRITSTANLTSGNYLIVGYYGGNYYALKNAANSSYTSYPDGVSVTPSSDVISNPAATIIWNTTVSGTTLKFYNDAISKYLYTYKSGSNYRMGYNATNSTATSYTASVSGGAWTLTNGSYTSYKIYYYSSYYLFGASTSSSTIYLYKQQEETVTTTYYTTDTSLTVTAVPDDSTQGSTTVQIVP